MSKNYEILKKATNINGEPFQIIKVPLPRPIETAITVVAERGPMDRKEKKIAITDLIEGHEVSVGDTIYGVAASGYLNFLITNDLVLVAQYEDYGSKDKDEEAREILQTAFPERKIVMMDVRPLNSDYGGGGIHCVTMQQPKLPN
jgi:agmatine deiminase